MKLIVGLGNPGASTARRATTSGFMVVDEVARRHQLTWAMAPAQVPETFVAKRFGDAPVLLAKPLTFMNRSGDVVAALARYYDVRGRRTCWWSWTKRRCRSAGCGRGRSGSAGGHNGLKSIIERLGHRPSFPGCGWGWGAATARRDLADHVLAKFETGERAELEDVHHPGGRCRRDVRRGGHRQGDEHVQPGRCGAGQLTDSLPPA